MTNKVFVVIPDMQVPHHAVEAVNAVQQFVKDFQPDELLCVGDEADSEEVGQWTKGLAGEMAGTLQQNFDLTAEVMLDFKKALGDKPFNVMRSNHTDRLKKYLTKYAPALTALTDLKYEKLVRYEENGIEFRQHPYAFAPGWLMAHGDESGSGSRVSGGTAMALARKFGGPSLVCGHTHKLGLLHDHDSVNGKITTYRYGFEVGHLMEFGDGENAASYLKAGSANWQQGFGIIWQHGDTVIPQAVHIVNKSFVVEGQRYSW